MKKLIILFFLFLPIWCTAQIPKNQEFSKERTEFQLIKQLMDEIDISGSMMYKGDLEIFTADLSGELSTAYYSFLDTSYFVLAFYNNRWNEYGTSFKEYSFKIMEIKQAKEFLLYAESMFNIYAGYNEMTKLEKNQFVIGQKAGIKIFIDESRELFVYWPEKYLYANWKISNLKRAKRRLEKALE